MISQIELENVYDFIVEANGTLENIQKAFLKKFTSEFHPLYFLYQALCDNLFTKGQRFVAIYLIYYSDLKQILYDVYNQSTDQFEKKFIYNPDQYTGYAAKTLIEESDRYTDTFNRELTAPKNMNQLRNVIPNPAQLRLTPPQNSLTIEQVRDVDDGFLGFELDFLRPVPIPIETEASWMEIQTVFDVQWNYTIQVNQDKLSQVKEIMQKAYQNQISDQEFKLLQDYFDSDQNLIKNCGFSPNQYPELIEKNPNLALFLTIKIYANVDFVEYIEKFMETDVTKNTMEVLSQIVAQLKIPQEFLTYYVHYCIQHCKSLKEKTQQNRMIRLVCVFTKVLIKHKKINFKEVQTELQAFSIEYSKISEASNLFKAIKGQDQQ